MEFQKEELKEILNIFQQESFEIISSMDGKLLLLERDEDNLEIAIQLFRDAHSLKGSARMLGFNHIQNIAHKIEDVISLIKEKKLKISSEITDAISECLELISVSINKTVENNAEYISPQSDIYLEKLKKVADENIARQQEFNKNRTYSNEENKFKESFLAIENIITDMLYIVTKSRQDKEFSAINNLEGLSQKLISLLEEINDEEIQKFINFAKKVLKSVEKFKTSSNKEVAFLEINMEVNSLIEKIALYADKKGIQRRNYYETVDSALIMDNDKNILIPKLDAFEQTKLDELIQRIPILELNIELYDEVFDILNDLIQKEKLAIIQNIYKDTKEILSTFKSKKALITREVAIALKEIFEIIKLNDIEKDKEALKKLDLFKALVTFEQKENKTKDAPKNELSSQKEILNSITNTEIKTLRVDSIKLDNLVGQIGELIVSKIKTNEQLSLAKKINNDLLDWQKNFVKMNYYIKYFDKKYLSNPLKNEQTSNSKIISYNKQLLTLSEQHNEKIIALIKEMSNLFRQLQESEVKLNTTTNEIETMVKNMRVLPLSTIFQLFPRMVHNIARDKNKKIDLIINGSDVSADKKIVEELKIPIMHIIRNSIDHGIEDIEERKKLGKDLVGKIEIDAYYKDSFVVVDIKDDGRGLNIEKIKQKALEKKLLTQEEINAINDEELMNLIFYPGFSTEDFVTELSGRGLGLDIVNTKINQLQGRIDVFSQMNEGTVVRVTLPSNIATKKVFIIEEQKQLFAIETSLIRTILRINPDDIFEKDDNYYYIYNDSAIPIYSLSQILKLENKSKENKKYTLAIIEIENMIFGIIVQKLISDQDIVLKKLSAPLYKVKHISGITTLANGEACLILNVGDIISTIQSRKIKTKISIKNELSMVAHNEKYKILVVDDSHTTRILQKNILLNQGYEVSTATEPLSALEKIKQNKFDLILSDVQMPNMNGFEFIKELRKNQNYVTTPIIVVSSEPMENYTSEIEETKIVKYIQKNLFKQNELIELIQNILDN